MKKKQRQMIGMLLALVVLAAAFLGIRQYNKNASSATSITEDTQETVLDVNSDDITSFRYVYEGETYAFEKEDETWYYADDHSLNLNQDRIKAMILKVAPLKADQVIENVTDMSQYGLADPERTIQYETADRSVIINVGNLNSMTSQYYIAFPSAEVRIVGNDGTNRKLSVKGDGSFVLPINPHVDYLVMASCKGYLNHKEELRVDSAKRVRNTCSSSRWLPSQPLSSSTTSSTISTRQP